MKLLIAIVNNEDSAVVSSALTKDGFSVTKLSTTGGFLMVGNTTFLIGADDKDVDKAKEIIKKNSETRTRAVPSTAALGGGLSEGELGVEVKIGGAIVFTVDVEGVDKY
ncbi:MAG: cyclic-di-AMP receptor [Clostridia bacterium]|nr:cyclic-di-AMP receptor [Clostridia bacterium]